TGLGAESCWGAAAGADAAEAGVCAEAGDAADWVADAAADCASAADTAETTDAWSLLALMCTVPRSVMPPESAAPSMTVPSALRSSTAWAMPAALEAMAPRPRAPSVLIAIHL